MKTYFLRQDNFDIEVVEKSTSFSIKTLKPSYGINKEPLEGYVKLVFHCKDLEALHAKVKANGVKEVLGITYDKTFDSDFFIVEDTDGNMLQFLRKR